MNSSPSIIDTCLCSVDGTDCRIREPAHFSFTWLSHKLHGPGLRYEVAVSIHYGNIIWVYEPFHCGSWPDLKIFLNKLATVLLGNERVVADTGYQHVQRKEKQAVDRASPTANSTYVRKEKLLSNVKEEQKYDSIFYSISWSPRIKTYQKNNYLKYIFRN